MDTLPASHPVRFVMAVVAAFAISFSLASVAAMTGLLPQSSAESPTPAFLDALAGNLRAATVIAAQSAAAQYAPAGQQSTLVPDHDDADAPALVALAKTTLPESGATPRGPSS